MWNDNDLHLRTLVLHDQFIHVEIRVKDERAWFLSAVYPSPREAERRILWEDLEHLNMIASES